MKLKFYDGPHQPWKIAVDWCLAKLTKIHIFKMISSRVKHCRWPHPSVEKLDDLIPVEALDDPPHAGKLRWPHTFQALNDLLPDEKLNDLTLEDVLTSPVKGPHDLLPVEWPDDLIQEGGGVGLRDSTAVSSKTNRTAKWGAVITLSAAVGFSQRHPLFHTVISENKFTWSQWTSFVLLLD